MPANCSADVEAVIAHVDSVFASNDSAAIRTMKANFGFQDVEYADDVGAARTFPFTCWLVATFVLGRTVDRHAQ